MTPTGPTADPPDSLASQGLAMARSGNLDAAISLLSEAVRLRPDHTQTHHNLGVALADRGRLDDAARVLKAALTIDPNYADAHYNLGAVYQNLGKLDEALACYWRSHELRPEHVDTLNNLGLALIGRHRSEEAIVLLQHAVRQRPDSSPAFNNLGLAYIDVGEYDRAIACFEQALKADPRSVDALSNLPTAYKEAGNLKRALAHHDYALRLHPNRISIRWNRALCLLQMGDYVRGWSEYECRRQKAGHEMLSLPTPYWDGSPLAGRVLLLHAEQGRGDAIQFIRYARRVPRDGGQVIFFAPRDLALLFKDCHGVDSLVVDGTPLPHFDVHASILSLPHLLGRPEPDDDVRYLVADLGRRLRWKERLAEIPGMKVGICWQGNPKHGNDHHRSLPLHMFGPLGAMAGVSLVSLQRGFGTEQIERFRRHHRLVAFDHDDDDSVAFAESAALIAELPLVVAVDTAVAHLAGALGVRTLMATSARCDWRWQSGRTNSDWYPSMTLVRQQTLDQWDPVMAEVMQIVEGIASRIAGTSHSHAAS